MVTKIAILGAQGTGKSWFASALFEALADRAADFLLLDTTAFTRAIEHELLFGDADADPATLAHPHKPDLDKSLNLVMGLDWPWVADDSGMDGLLRRSQVDARLRQVMQAAQLNYVVIYGQGTARTECALRAMAHHTDLPLHQTKPTSPWQWACDNCSDGACEHRMFTGLLKPS